MAGDVLDLQDVLNRDSLAEKIGETWQRYDNARSSWKERAKETAEYIFATDTYTTSNAQSWSNSTHIPKLCQIRDNLHANIMASLFPSRRWFTWEAGGSEDTKFKKKLAIMSYVSTKAEQSDLKTTVSQLVYDLLDFGNCFCQVQWSKRFKKSKQQGDFLAYEGPQAVRIHPQDIVFNPLATIFVNTPKIVRSYKTIGEMAKMLSQAPQDEDAKKLWVTAIENAKGLRNSVGDSKIADLYKNNSLGIDGFGSIFDYITSDTVELLTFYGDLYDEKNGKLYEDSVITVVDRSFILSIKENETWETYSPIFHCGWRLRQDNLYAMGPLDNLVGLQYRLNHLENLKADVFDLIAYPVIKFKGVIPDGFQYGPKARIFCGDDGDVEFMRPDSTALTADLQINQLEQRMEEMAGAPKQAMGIRSPGEKTAREVQILENSTGRFFQKKVEYFESMIIEQILNSFLSLGAQNLSSMEQVRRLNGDESAQLFSNIKKTDLIANGTLKARGASHFARQANMVQDLAWMLSLLQADPDIKAHISGLGVANMFRELMNIQEEGLISENIRLAEQVKSAVIKTRLEEEAKMELDQKVSPSELSMKAMEVAGEENVSPETV